MAVHLWRLFGQVHLELVEYYPVFKLRLAIPVHLKDTAIDIEVHNLLDNVLNYFTGSQRLNHRWR